MKKLKQEIRNERNDQSAHGGYFVSCLHGCVSPLQAKLFGVAGASISSLLTKSLLPLAPMDSQSEVVKIPLFVFTPLMLPSSDLLNFFFDH